jgi:hypothetical protein
MSYEIHGFFCGLFTMAENTIPYKLIINLINLI